MNPDFRSVLPSSFEPNYEILDAHRLARQFYQEVCDRAEFEQYCQVYAAMAEAHRQEHQAMQGDPNLLGWFYRSR
jgi:hypothetical protein